MAAQGNYSPATTGILQRRPVRGEQIALAARAADDSTIVQKPLEGVGRLLTAAAGMMRQARLGPAMIDGHLQPIEEPAGFRTIAGTGRYEGVPFALFRFGRFFSGAPDRVAFPGFSEVA